MAGPKKVNVLADFRKLDSKSLTETVAALRAELVEQHKAHKAGELPSAAAITKTRKSIAKAMTVLAEQAALKPEKKEQEK